MKRLLAAITLLAITTPALAQSRACDRLYYLRNEFYNSKGLCFTRPEAIRRFPENPDTCQYSSSEDLPMSAKDHRAMEMIRDSEIRLGCLRH
jgi:hypothetical protein